MLHEQRHPISGVGDDNIGNRDIAGHRGRGDAEFQCSVIGADAAVVDADALDRKTCMRLQHNRIVAGFNRAIGDTERMAAESLVCKPSEFGAKIGARIVMPSTTILLQRTIRAW